MRIPIIISILYATTSFGATLELEAFDFKNCLHWHMTSDTGGASSEAYKIAHAMLRPNFSVFAAGVLQPDGRNIEKFGVCSFQYVNDKAKFHCLPNQDYPFAGATYVSAPTQNYRSVAVLSCVSGCNKGAPDSIFEINQDIPDDLKRHEKEERQRMSRFRRQCGEK